MSYCINPHCPKPYDPLNIDHNICRQCGSDLLIKNRYRVIKPIGTGGFGKTYEVDDVGTSKVLKVLHKTSAKAVSLFKREAEVLKQLDHPGIPKVEPDGDFPFRTKDSRKLLHCLVMEKIEGQNLQEWLESQDNQGITAEQATDWLKQLVEILDHFHQRNYFHRDISPRNIILQPNGQLVLIDFGGVRKVSNTFLAKFKESNVTKLFTEEYSPPEQKSGEAVPQSDFFALGRTFVHLLTGVSPTELSKDIDGKLIWRDTVTSSIPESLADLIDELMAHNPEWRPQTTQAILQRIQCEILGSALSVVQPTGQQGISQPNIKSKWFKELSKTRKPLIGLGLIGLGIAAVTTVTVLNFPKLTPLQRQLPTPQPNRSLPSPRRQSSALLANNISLLNTFRGHSDFVHAVAFSPDGQTLVSGSKDNTNKLWNWRTGKVLRTFSGASSEVWSVAISPDGRILASGHWQDRTIKLWDIRTGKLLRTLKGHSGEVRSVAFSPDGQTLVSSSQDRTIKLWRISTGELIYTFFGHTDHVGSVAFSPDGKTVASACDDNTVKLWRLDNMKLVRTLKGHTDYVLSIAFSPDGQTLVSGSADKTIRLWNPTTGVRQRTLPGHSDSVWCLAISPDGQYIASGSYDNSIKLWNLRTGVLLRTLQEHSDRVYSVAFSPNGQTIASGSWDNTVRIWGVAP